MPPDANPQACGARQRTPGGPTSPRPRPCRVQTRRARGRPAQASKADVTKCPTAALAFPGKPCTSCPEAGGKRGARSSRASAPTAAPQGAPPASGNTGRPCGSSSASCSAAVVGVKFQHYTRVHVSDPGSGASLPPGDTRHCRHFGRNPLADRGGLRLTRTSVLAAGPECQVSTHS